MPSPITKTLYRYAQHCIDNELRIVDIMPVMSGSFDCVCQYLDYWGRGEMPSYLTPNESALFILFVIEAMQS